MAHKSVNTLPRTPDSLCFQDNFSIEPINSALQFWCPVQSWPEAILALLWLVHIHRTFWQGSFRLVGMRSPFCHLFKKPWEKTGVHTMITGNSSVTTDVVCRRYCTVSQTILYFGLIDSQHKEFYCRSMNLMKACLITSRQEVRQNDLHFQTCYRLT